MVAMPGATDQIARRKILIVEDDQNLARILRDNLSFDGYTVECVGDGNAAIDAVQSFIPDLVLLDITLPGRDGFDLCPLMRQHGRTPVIILTARSQKADKLRGLDLGADDYITKPFSPRELVARVKSVLRRVDAAGAGGDVFRRGDLTVDATRMRVTRGDALIDLTATEFQLLAALARQPGRIFTRAHLLDVVRGTDVESFERAIDTHVKNIRRKLEADPRTPHYILTVYGMGYKFAE
jgi:DNA-binding response OmpR family regulator